MQLTNQNVNESPPYWGSIWELVVCDVGLIDLGREGQLILFLNLLCDDRLQSFMRGE